MGYLSYRLSFISFNMETQSPISFKLILICFITSVIIISILYLTSLFDKHTRLIFCNVGEGLSIYIRVQNKADVLINAGPDKKILNCLSKYMPFFDRTIEYVLLTTSSSNAIGGMQTVFKRYSVEKIYLPRYFEGNKYTDYLNSYIKEHTISTFVLESSKNLRVLDSEFIFLTFTSNMKTFFPVLFTLDHYKALLFNATTGRDAIKFAKSPTVIEPHNLYLIQLPFMGLTSDPFTNFLSLAEPTYIVINKQSFNIDEEILKKIKDRIKAKNVKFELLNSQEDAVFIFN